MNCSAPILIPTMLASCLLVLGCPGGGGGEGDTTGGTSTGAVTTTGSPATSTSGSTDGTSSSSGDGATGPTSSGDTTDGTSSGSGESSSSSESTGGSSGEACFDGGVPAAGVSGAGTCASPYVIDLSAEPHGTIVTHALAGGTDEMDLFGGCDIPPVGTARDVVYHVLMPADVNELHVSVDATAGADPRIAVAEDPECFQPMNACADDLGPGECEGLVAPRSGEGFFSTTTYVVINEFVDSGAELTVRFFTAP